MDEIKLYSSHLHPNWGKAVVILAVGTDAYGNTFGEYHALLPSRNCHRESIRFKAEQALVSYLTKDNPNFMWDLLMEQVESCLYQLPFEGDEPPHLTAFESIRFAEEPPSLLGTMILAGYCLDEFKYILQRTESEKLRTLLQKVTGYGRLASREI